MSELGQAMLINVAVLIVVLESDLGPRRKITWFRALRPILLAGAIVPLYLDGFSTRGVGLTVELAAAAAGVALGAVAAMMMRVYRSPSTGRPVSGAGCGYAALWVVVIGSRMTFSYGSAHWFGDALGRWLIDNNVDPGAIGDSLIVMAVLMLLTRTVGLVARANALPPVAQPAPVDR